MRSVLLDIPTNHYFSEVNALEAFFELLWGLLMFFVMLMLVAAVVLYIIFFYKQVWYVSESRETRMVCMGAGVVGVCAVFPAV